MSTVHKVGIWLDHSAAHIVEYSGDALETMVISSKFTPEVRSESLHKGESTMHNKEQLHIMSYYKALEEVIKKYDEVVLFGPTHAKDELMNLLRKDHTFDHIQIHLEQTDKMAESEIHAYVRDYFLKSMN